MAISQINPYNAPAKEKEESTWDKIFRGLQFAEQALKIPVAWEQYKAYQSEADLKGQEVKMRERQEKGSFTPAEAAKSGLRVDLIPPTPTTAQPGLVPPQGQAPVFGPPQPPKEVRFSKIPSYDINIVGPEGKLLPAKAFPQDAEEKAYAQEASLRKEYENNDSIKIAEQASLNYANAVRGLEKGNKEGDLLALQNVMKLYNPGVTKTADGSTIANADSIFSDLGKRFEELRSAATGQGGEKIVLQPEERLKLKQLVDEAYDFYAAEGTAKANNYKSLAEQSGFLPKNIGYKEYGVKREPRDSASGKSASSHSESSASSASNIPKEIAADVSKLSPAVRQALEKKHGGTTKK